MSRTGVILAGAYIAICAVLISTQGLFGESFISLILGLPWTLGLAFFEYFNADGALVYALALAPLALNAMILYWIGARVSRRA